MNRFIVKQLNAFNIDRISSLPPNVTFNLVLRIFKVYT